jgi:hypothetical protein
LQAFLYIDPAEFDAAVGRGRTDHRTNIPARMQADILKLDLVGQSRLERLIDEHSGLALKFLFRSWPVSTNVHLQEAIDALAISCLLCDASPLRVKKRPECIL